MSNSTEENRVHFLKLPVEIHLEILRQVAEFYDDQVFVLAGITRSLKDIRL